MKDFDDEVKINRFKLELECERHASLYYSYAEERAKTKEALDNSNDKLKLTLAEKETLIRKNWNDDKGKQTDASVKALLETNDDVLKLKERVRKIQADLYVLDAACYALEHRKAMLDNLIQLLVKGFYAAPYGGKQEGPVEEAQREIRSMKKRRSNEQA